MNHTSSLKAIISISICMPFLGLPANANRHAYGDLTLQDGKSWKTSKFPASSRKKLESIEKYLDQIAAKVTILLGWKRNQNPKSTLDRKRVRDSMADDIDEVRRLITEVSSSNLYLKKSGKEVTSLSDFGKTLLWARDQMFGMSGQPLFNVNSVSPSNDIELFLQGDRNTLRGIDTKTRRLELHLEKTDTD